MPRPEPSPNPRPPQLNLVVLRGVLSSPPRRRDLPSGSAVTHLDVTVRTADGVSTAPVVVHDAAPHVDALEGGDEVVVVGRVERRFFRAGGVTQSRTEVVAERVARGTRQRAVDQAWRRVDELLRAGRLGAGRVGVG